ncbi:hypothetical protein ACFO0J_14105 [Castellaniella hirudinis]|uniref:Uncharacterized protein n=1 Tax=Castellaniella hirudinis TaxID=1144617 RepID=A0ABV8S200_9BURK
MSLPGACRSPGAVFALGRPGSKKIVKARACAFVRFERRDQRFLSVISRVCRILRCLSGVPRRRILLLTEIVDGLIISTEINF